MFDQAESSTICDRLGLDGIAPYIGRLRASAAASLVQDWTKPGDLVVDPFCGGGSVPLFAAVQGRHVLAGDWNPYAVLLTRAKLFPPASAEIAMDKLHMTWNAAQRLRPTQDLRSVPAWVRRFFHPETLRELLAFRDACISSHQDFLLACLLGILHHQRPGFLSFPSSHLLPYLRSKRFPRDRYPDLYEYRGVLPRLAAKIGRVYKRYPGRHTVKRAVHLSEMARLPLRKELDAVITSPPYMNELDYVRDNRLRLWVLQRSVPTHLEIRAAERVVQFTILMQKLVGRFAAHLKRRGRFILVLGQTMKPSTRLVSRRRR